MTTNTSKKTTSRTDILQSNVFVSFCFDENRQFEFSDVPADVLEKIDSVINDVISGHGEIPLETETHRSRSQTRSTQQQQQQQHHVICDSTYLPLNSDLFHWSSTSQQQNEMNSTSSQHSERGVVAELISTILSNGPTTTM